MQNLLLSVEIDDTLDISKTYICAVKACYPLYGRYLPPYPWLLLCSK